MKRSSRTRKVESETRLWGMRGVPAPGPWTTCAGLGTRGSRDGVHPSRVRVHRTEAEAVPQREGVNRVKMKSTVVMMLACVGCAHALASADPRPRPAVPQAALGALKTMYPQMIRSVVLVNGQMVPTSAWLPYSPPTGGAD